MNKHQYGFDIMNWRTGKTRVKSFWGYGETDEACKKDALMQARQYAASLSDAEYQKAYDKARAKNDYPPSSESYRFQVVGHTRWK